MMRGVLITALACVGCVEPTASTQIESEARAKVVDVTVVEFSVSVDVPDAPAGLVLFRVHNVGEEEHEFIVVKTDLSIPEMPLNADGSLNEEGEGIEVVHEVEDIAPGSTRGVLVRLESGHHVLLCNRVEVEEDGEVEAHFSEGMRTDFNVI